MTEPTYACPKCGNPFPMSQLHNHYQTCQGKPVQQQQPVNQWLQSPFPQQTPQQWEQPKSALVVPVIRTHQHRWSENNTYKVCIAYLYDASEECREIKVKLRGSWQIFIRYGLKLLVIQMIIALAFAFSVASLFGVHR